MTINPPLPRQIPQLRTLWKEAFGDSDEFLDIFFHRAFAPERSRCITRDGSVVAALYWFDCSWQDKRLAYLYAVATAKSQRGQGLCRLLMEDTHRHLAEAGYDGCVLAPQSKDLFSMYSKFGYTICSYVREFSCAADGCAIPLHQADPDEYAALRRRLLPEDSVLQEGATLDFLSTYGQLYTGTEIALAAYPYNGELIVCELLGDPEKAPQILTTLGYTQGSFRVPGNQRPLTMYLPLRLDPGTPHYFGIILD